MTEQNKPTPDRFERAKQILDTVNAEFPGHPLGWNSGRPWLELADKFDPRFVVVSDDYLAAENTRLARALDAALADLPSRPAIPADAEKQLNRLLVRACNAEPLEFFPLAEARKLLASWSAPAVGLDTTDDDETCGDCVEGHCHWGGADPAPGEQCGCARHTASMLARERNTQQHTDATARWKVGDIARWQYRKTGGYPEWFTLQLLDDSPNTDHDWHGKVIKTGTYPDVRVGTDMYVMENCLSVVPAGQEGGA